MVGRESSGEAGVTRRLMELLRAERQRGFPSFPGASAGFTLPIAESFVTKLIAEALPATAPVGEVVFSAMPGDRFTIALRVLRPVFLPRVTLSFTIERQPEFPRAPELVLRVRVAGLSGIAALAAPVLRMFEAVPRGVRLDGERVHVDVAAIAEQQGAADLLRYVEALQVHTREHELVVSFLAQVAHQ